MSNITRIEIVNQINLIDKIPLPSMIEISNSGTCNRSCVFCPRSDINFPNIKQFISTELIIKLSKQLAEVNYSGLLLFAGFSEPMLDKNIYRHISIIRSHLPSAIIEVVTNGDSLNKSRIEKLFNSGLSRLLISAYDSEEQATQFQKMCNDANTGKGYIEVRHRYLPPDEKFGIMLSNRGGAMDNAIFNIPSVEKPLTDSCFYPSYMFFVNYKGDVLLCPHDWNEQGYIGNLTSENFIDIWQNDKFIEYRKKILNGDRNHLPCAKCDVPGKLMGEKHAELWLKQINECH